MCKEEFNRATCGEVRRKPSVNVGRPGQTQRYSGFIIVRLAAKVKDLDEDDLIKVAKNSKLNGLTAILSQFELVKTRRVIRSLKAEKILALEREAAKTELPPYRSLTSYWRIDARHRAEQAEEILKRLNVLPEVDLAYRELKVSDPQVNDANDPYAGDQDYLDAAPTGIDARWAWTQVLTPGLRVGFVDLEQGWFPNHEDLVAKTPTLIYGDNRNGEPILGGIYKGNHGTAVLGEVVAEDNTIGAVGIACSVPSVRMVSHYDRATDTDLHVADAILAAIPVMSRGDVLLLEVQRDYLPTEIDDADFDAIRLTVAHGIIVVEAAGNGNEDLDAYTNALGDLILNRGDAAFRESAAIMVGASESALPHDRWYASNFGSRIDCYGWGENIVTCGYGDLDPGTGDNSTYTDTFGGTSGASPMIVGAALIIQDLYEATTGTRLSPGQMRTLLSDPTTGTPQGLGRPGNISVMPDLRAIIQNTLNLVPDVYLRDDVGDSGVVPSVGAISASPDVILRPDPVADPNASFGEGSGTENSATEGYVADSNRDNYIYVRMKNRGGSNADGVTATVYWSEVATLITPDMWNLIGTTLPVNVPTGDTLVVTDALLWPEAQIPAVGHYCFTALLDHPQDPTPPLPPGPPHFDWDAFKAFIRNHNNVTWRNFNVEDIPDPAGDPAALPFIIAGAPDRARVFDFEIRQKLPKGAKVWLEVPLILASKVVQGRLWETKMDRNRQVARILLPFQPRLPLCGVRLPAGARYRSRFLVKGVKGMGQGGHGLVISQLFENDEVGRITWQFHLRKEGKKRGS